MASHGYYDQPPLLTQLSSENPGRGDGGVALTEPSAPNRNPARTVGGKRVPDRKLKDSDHCLFCPVCAGQPARYAKVTKKCKPGATYKGLSKLMEHINRVHSPESFCLTCMRALQGGITWNMHSETCQPRTLTTEQKEAYPTLLPSDVLFSVQNWKKTAGAPKDGKSLVEHRWEHIYGIIYPGEPIPDAMPKSPGSSFQPPASHSPVPRGKRQASSSPDCKPRGSRRRQASPEAQAADRGDEVVGFEPAPVDLSQPQPGGHSAMLFEEWPRGPSYPGDFRCPFSADDAADEASIIPILGMESMAPSDTTAVTGLPPFTFDGTTAYSETSGFFEYADQRPQTPLYLVKDGDNTDSVFQKWELEIMQQCEKERALGSELVPGTVDYPADLENEPDLMAITNTMDPSLDLESDEFNRLFQGT
ncbi:uncharacterized protein B0H64DRAFT_160686 [Chaetomium fimeti]|uniref:Uncharacterized protein n=1 Tax=Chaetomium fimeti TaxID=1854472 RepID=A0AAE0HGV8_9PEZI|nr:hypothetical protein B0H64DRAFT_160686 [Chaetomium fimeti]